MQIRAKVIAAVSAVNPEVANRIKSYTVNSDGTVTITYKDSTTNVVAVKLSDSDHSQSVSNSQSASAKTSQSISQSLSAKQSTERIDSAERFIEPVTELGSLTKFVSFTKPISIGKRIRSSKSISQSIVEQGDFSISIRFNESICIDKKI